MQSKNMLTDNFLPNWSWVKLSNVCEINPKLDTNGLEDKTEVSFLPMRAVEELSGKINLSETRGLDKVKKGYTYFGEGDVIFAKITPCMENGKIAITTKLKNRIGFGSTEFHVIRCNQILINKYLFFYLVQSSYRKLARRNMTGTAGQLRVPKRFIENTEIPLPPLPDQNKIVEKLEELFSQLDSGIASLKKANEQIRLYRQSVLASAFSGSLVRQSAHHQYHLPVSQEVLKAAEPQIHYTNLLSDSWKWVKVSDVGEVVTGTTPSKTNMDYYKNDYPLYKPTDLNAGYYTRESADQISKLGATRARLNPEKSIMVTCIGATIGKTGMSRKIGATNQQINSIIPNDKYLPEFVYYFCISEYFQDQIKKHASSTTLPILNKTKFQQLPFIEIPKNEQIQIVEEIERRFSEADNLEKTIDESLIKAESLKQSILKQAFEGKLIQ